MAVSLHALHVVGFPFGFQIKSDDRDGGEEGKRGNAADNMAGGSV